MSAGLFEVLAADDREQRLASRKALLVSRARIDERLGSFLGAARTPEEFVARYELVDGDFKGIIRVTAAEYGHGDSDSLVETLRDHYQEKTAEKWIQKVTDKSDFDKGGLHRATDTPEDEKIPESKIEDLEEHGDKNEKEKAQFAENVKKGSKTACDHTSYVEDCPDCEKSKKKSKKDKKKDKSLPPWLKGKGHGDDDDGDDDGDDTLEFSARADDVVPLAAKTAGPPDQNNTDLDGPSPKMKKQRWTPKSIGEPDTGDSDKGPTKDALEVMPKKNEGPPGDISNIDDEIRGRPNKGEWSHQDLPTAKGAENLDDAGFASNNQEMAPHTKTFGDKGQTEPVKSESLEG